MPNGLAERSGCSEYSITNHFLGMHSKLRLLPQSHDLAPLHPVVAFRIELEIKSPDDLGDYKAHLGVCEVLVEALSARTLLGCLQARLTLPRQFLGPKENGWMLAFLSSA